MPPFIVYLLKVSLCLALVYLLYQLLLRRLTFYNWNRWYLLGYTGLSFVVPLINIAPVLEKNDWSANGLVQWVPVISHSAAPSPSATVPGGWNYLPDLALLLFAGMVIMALRLLVQVISFRQMQRKATLLHPGKTKVYKLDTEIIPFSFGNSIFVNPVLHTESELQEIIRHEFVHIRQKHTIDIIWSELLCLVNWYNPAAWMLKKAIRQNLEFIADQQVLQNGIPKKEYQYLLLKVTGYNAYSIATPFNFSSLKKRIAMMNKLQSAKVNLLRFLFILPLLAVILVSFRHEIGDTLSPAKKVLPYPRALLAVIDTVPPVTAPNNKGYFIDIIGVNGECMVVVKDKNKKEVKRVLLNEWKEKQEEMESVYGDIPAPPAPEAPLAPVAPDAPVTPAPPGAPAAPHAPHPPIHPECGDHDPAAYTFAPGATGSGYLLSDISNDYEISDKTAVIKLKNGETEKYDLTFPEQKAQFEKKYGKYYTYSVQPARAAEMAAYYNRYTVTPAAITPYPGVPYPADETSYRITGKEDIVITITRKSTRADLDRFISEMKSKGVELNFDRTDFDGKGNLISLSGTMRSGGSQSNFSASDFSKLVLAMVRKDDKTWFKVNTSDREVI